ncbi:hypothetical protein HY449_02175 [Candidatus Pacearchaeota archaeon]|nr:hypothetical protein [Candidatus Pacearchaeota archaeon]
MGLGITDEKKLEEMLSQYENFVVKPIRGLQGRGVRFLSRQEVMDKYKSDKSFSFYGLNLLLDNLSLGKPKRKHVPSVEEMVCDGDFSFEDGISQFQPFVESRKNGFGEYSSIRAIVCNGKFVDAYMRTSVNPRVNLSQDAKAVSFYYDSNFPEFCENIAGVFETKVKEQDSENFKRDIYQKYLEGIGRGVEKWEIFLEKEMVKVFLFAVKQSQKY